MDRELLLEKYLMNELNDAEWHQFKTLLESDEDFKDEVEIRSILYADYKTDLKKELLKNRPAFTGLKKPKIRHMYRRVLSIAAIVLIGIAGLMLYQINSSTDFKNLAVEYLNEQPPGPTILMGPTDSDNQFRKAAIEAYQNEQYSEAAHFFEKIEQPGNLEYFYLGLSYLYQNPRVTQKAIENFKEVIETPNNFTEEALWYISLSYVLQNEKVEARNYLSQIKKTSTNYENATVLLKKINLKL